MDEQEQRELDRLIEGVKNAKRIAGERSKAAVKAEQELESAYHEVRRWEHALKEHMQKLTQVTT